MSTTLLFGNGFNLVTNPECSWTKLLEDVGAGAFPKGSYVDIPYPVVAELIPALRGSTLGRRNDDLYKTLRKSIAEYIIDARMNPNEIHAKFRNMDFDYFVTTNYDTCFERAGERYEPEPDPASNRKYLLAQTGNVEGRNIYHAHGIVDKPNTICISFVRYMSLISRIRDGFILKGSDQKDKEDYAPLIDSIKNREEPIGCWPELFFKTNMHIVGFGLVFFEFDFWWLLSLRKSLFEANPVLKEYENIICFHFLDTPDKRCKDKRDAEAKRIALQALGVECIQHQCNSYEEGYEKAANHIDKDIKRY